VGEGDAFGFARGAGGKEKEGFVVTSAFTEVQELTESGDGKEFGKYDPFDDFLFDVWEESLDEDEVTVGWPRKVGELPHEGVGGDEAVDVGLSAGGFEGGFGGGEVKVYRDFSSKEDGKVSDEAAFSRRKDDAHALFLSKFFELFRKSDGGAENFPIRKDVVRSAIIDGGIGVFFEPREKSDGKGSFKKVARGEGALFCFE